VHLEQLVELGQQGVFTVAKININVSVAELEFAGVEKLHVDECNESADFRTVCADNQNV
jgi:hypothetical protein